MLPANRCGECENCRKVILMQGTTLRCVINAANRGQAVSDDVVQLWNDTLKDNPCSNPPKREQNHE